jgi:hypothetical protein
MRLLAGILAFGLAGMAGAECLPPGQLPAKVTFDNGEVMDEISRVGDTLHYTMHLKGDLTAKSEMLWGLYPMRWYLEGDAVFHHWMNRMIPAPLQLPTGKAVKLRAQQEMAGQLSDFSMTLRLIGAEEVTVGNCRYPVLHVATRSGVRGASVAEAEVWLDPDRLVVWARKQQVFDSSGALIGDFHAQAAAVE